MKFLDFFAGVGGFRRGMELAGHECVGFCEIDKYAVMSYTSMHLITDEQRAYLATLDLKKRQKEILKEEYRNGEWYSDDISRVDARSLPSADCYCFGFPCQDISVCGHGKGLQEGTRSNLFFEVMRLIDERKESGLDLPRYLFIENVKNLFSVNRGFDFVKVLSALDERGYDAEWQLLDSQDFQIPQHRERVFIIGHLRGSGGSEVLPIQGTDGENCVHQIGMDGTSKRKNHNQYRLYSADGLAPTLNKMDGGGDENLTFLSRFNASIRNTDSSKGGARIYEEETPTLTSRDYKDPLQITVPIIERRKANEQH